MAPTSTIERPRLTRKMYAKLKVHITNVRSNQEKDRAKDEALQRQRRQEAIRLLREKENHQTLEQTKMQILDFENRSKQLILEKHEHFAKLKIILMKEDENRKTSLAKEQNDIMALHHHQQQQQQQQQHQQQMALHAAAAAAVAQVEPGHFLLAGAGGVPASMPHPSNTQSQSQKYLAMSQQHQQYLSSIKRGRSPSPNTANHPSNANPYPGSQYAGFNAALVKEFAPPPHHPASAAAVAGHAPSMPGHAPSMPGHHGQPPVPPQQQQPPPPPSQQAPPPPQPSTNQTNYAKQIKNAGPYSHRQSPSQRNHAYHSNSAYHPNAPMGSGGGGKASVTSSSHMTQSTPPQPQHNSSAPTSASPYPSHFSANKNDARYNAFNGNMPSSNYIVPGSESLKREEHFKQRHMGGSAANVGQGTLPNASKGASIVTGFSGHANNYPPLHK